MYRSESFDESGLVERIEIERFDPSTVEYSRYDGSLVLQERRPATTEEEVSVDAEIAQEIVEQKATNVSQAVTALRQWAADAKTITVTNNNSKAVLQTTVDRLGIFFDRFADLIESRLD